MPHKPFFPTPVGHSPFQTHMQDTPFPASDPSRTWASGNFRSCLQSRRMSHFLTCLQASRDFTCWACWHERIEPAKLSMIPNTESRVKKVIWRERERAGRVV